jgi:hypothetical protein
MPFFELARFIVGRAGWLPLYDYDVPLAGEVIRQFLERTYLHHRLPRFLVLGFQTPEPG